jgi:hypothetical protein
MESTMLSRLPDRWKCIAIACILLPALGTSCPTTNPIDPNSPTTSVAGTYSGTAVDKTTVNTQLPQSGTTSTQGSGILSFTLNAYGQPTAVQVGFDNNGVLVSSFEISFASMSQGTPVNLPAGSAAEGYSQTGTITATAISFTGTGFHIVIQDNGSITYLSGVQAGLTQGGVTTSTYDGTVSGNILNFTESTLTAQTTKFNGATIGMSQIATTVTGSLTRQ